MEGVESHAATVDEPIASVCQSILAVAAVKLHVDLWKAALHDIKI